MDMERYRLMMTTGNPAPSTDPDAASASRVENAGRAPDLSKRAIEDRLRIASEQMHSVVRRHLNDESELHRLVDRMVDDGGRAFSAFAQVHTAAFSADPGLIASLESIVRTDGSRPSFMVIDGKPDPSTSPVGGWKDDLVASEDQLRKALRCVGRIDVPAAVQGFEGTGFLIAPNLVMTNRHVLQAIADRKDHVWAFRDGAAIDFGHEFRQKKVYPRRRLTEVVFAGVDDIGREGVDHTKLDLVLVATEPPAEEDRIDYLGLDASSDWADVGQTIYIAGYPGRPPAGGNPHTLLEQLFQSTYGCKRLAPGSVISSAVVTEAWTVAHDATTLGGNSGSVLLVAGREQLAAGLHYAGRSASPRENWGHVLGRALDRTDGISPKTLRQLLLERDVQLSDRRT